MGEVADFEMPSRKRPRVEAPDQIAAPGPSESVDEFDDIYGTPPKSSEEAAVGSLQPTSAELHIQSTDSQKPASLPTLNDLPGLGIAQKDAEPANGIAQFEEKDHSPNTSREKGLSIDVKDTVIGKSEVPGEIDTHENLEKRVVEAENGTFGAGDQTDALMGHEKTERGQDMCGSGLPKTLESPKAIADQSVAETVDSASVEADNGEAVGFQPPEGDNAKAPVEELPSNNASHAAEVEGSVLEPLAFLEASLLPAPSHKADSEALMAGIAENKTRAEGGPVNGAPNSEHLATDVEHQPDAEFEIDSSPLNSDFDTSDDSSSSSSDGADDYEMLDPEEQARRLMAEDGGSDEEGGGGKGKALGPLRTQNEKPDEDVPKPDVIVTEEMKIEELGSVEGRVENLILIKAKTSGEYQVLEQGSVLCLEDRTVIGVVAETLGRVQQPYYSVRFTNAAAISEAGLVEGMKIFYVEQYSTPVFTQPLKAFKGSDASNLHDEEVGDDELEFSDDEAEAEYKRKVKMQRQQKRMGRDGQNEGFSRGPRGGRGGVSRGGARGRTSYPQNGFAGASGLQEHAPSPAEGGLNYDDGEHDMNVDTEDLYTPLARPTNLHEMPRPSILPTESPAPQWGGDTGGHSRGRGRTDRGGGRGSGRSGRGRGQGQGSAGFGRRGGHPQSNGFQHSPPNNGGPPPWPAQQGNGFVAPGPPLQNQYPAAMPNQQPQPYPAFPAQYPHQWNQQHQAPQYLQQQHQQHHLQQQPPPHSPNTYHPQHLQQSPYAYPQPPLPAAPSQPTNSIPPGAHINPAFFRQPQPWPPQTHQ